MIVFLVSQWIVKLEYENDHKIIFLQIKNINVEMLIKLKKKRNNRVSLE